MSRRRVEVELILEAGNFLGEARAVAAETKAAGRTIDDLGDQADGASTDMKQLAANTDVAAHEVDKLGDQARQTAVDMELLDHKIAQTKRSVAALGLEFAATGNMKTGTRFRRESSLLGQLETLKADVTSGGGSGSFLGDVESLARTAGQRGGKVFGDSFGGAIDFGGKGIRPMHYLIGALVEALALALPAIGAMLAGVTAGAIGTAGLAGGILAASKDPLVKSAAKDFSDHISAEFFSWGTPFVEPIRESLGILQVDFDRLDLGSALEKVAPLMVTIASGFGDMAMKTMPGLNKALERMEPFAVAAADGFRQIGNALSGFFDDVTRSHGAIEGLRFFFSLLSGTIAFLGASLRWLSERFHDMNKTAAWVVQAMGNVADAFGRDDDANKLHGLSKQLNDFADHDGPLAEEWANLLGSAFDDTADKAKGLADRMEELNKRTEDNIESSLDLWQANIDVAQALADLNEKLIKGKGNWDLNTQAGRDNQQQLKNTIDALEAKRKKAVEESDGSIAAVNAVNAEFDKQLDAILKVAAAAGDAKAALDALEKTYHVNVIVDYQQTNQINKANAIDLSLANISGARASGGPVQDGAWLVGENGPEILSLRNNQQGFVANSAQQWQQLATASTGWQSAPSGGGGNSTITVVVQDTSGRTLRRELITDALNRNQSQATVRAAYP